MKCRFGRVSERGKTCGRMVDVREGREWDETREAPTGLWAAGGGGKQGRHRAHGPSYCGLCQGPRRTLSEPDLTLVTGPHPYPRFHIVTSHQAIHQTPASSATCATRTPPVSVSRSATHTCLSLSIFPASRPSSRERKRSYAARD